MKWVVTIIIVLWTMASGNAPARIIIYLPYDTAKVPFCFSMAAHIEWVMSEFKPSFSFGSDDTNLPATGEILEYIYKIYEEEFTVSPEYLMQMRIEDALIAQGSLAYLVRQNDTTGEIDGAMRMVRSHKDVNFMLMGNWPSEDMVDGETPLTEEFPHLKDELDKIGPHILWGRVATKPGAHRISTALAMFQKALTIFPTNPQIVADNYRHLKEERPIPVVAHAKDRQHNMLYQLLGLKPFFQPTPSDWILTRPSRELQDIFSYNMYRHAANANTYSYDAQLQGLEKGAADFTGRFREKNPIYLMLRAKIRLRHGHYQMSIADLNKLNEYLPGVQEVLDLRETVQMAASLDLYKGSGGNPERLRTIYEEWAAKLSSSFKGDSFSEISNATQTMALESADQDLVNFAYRRTGNFVVNTDDEILLHEKKYVKAKRREDFEKIWIDLCDLQIQRPGAAETPDFFHLKKLVAKRTGRFAAAARYARVPEVLAQLGRGHFNSVVKLPNE